MTGYWKRITACLTVILLMMACLSACTHGENNDPSTDPVGTTLPVTEPSQSIPTTEPSLPVVPSITGNADMLQLRMPGFHEDWVTRFESAFEGAVTVSDTQALSGFWAELAKLGKETDMPEECNEAFFAENYLVMIPMQSTSGSVQYDVQVELVGNKITITVAGKMPEAGTADMADWLLLIPLDRDAYPQDCEIEVNASRTPVTDPDLNISDR